MNFLTTTEMAEVWGISSRRIALLCSQGRVDGATMKGKNMADTGECKKTEDPRRVQKKGQ